MKITRIAVLLAYVLLAFSGTAYSQKTAPATDKANAAKSVPPNTAVKPSATPSAALVVPPVVAKYGNVLSQQLVGAGGLTAWTVEKNGVKLVLYTTADLAVIFSGIVWDASTGRNLSDQFIPAKSAVNSVSSIPMMPTLAPVTPSAMTSGTSKIVGAMDLKYTGALPESMTTVDQMAGIKEGKGGIADTVYIMFDPRCPFCRQAYNNTRAFVSQGRTIKWIPVVALGEPAKGVPLVATILQSKDKSVLDRVLGQHEQIETKPTADSIAAMDKSLSFMFAAFQQNGGKQPGVPVAFFLDHRTGTPRMLTGVSEMVVLHDIFGRP
jgi:thiol:disulfide interchange protein DsbG